MNKKNKKFNWLVVLLSAGAIIPGCSTNKAMQEPISVSGIYPHLAMYNKEGECGTGAVVPWGGKLWAMTYGPHLPFGSSDKLYEIDQHLNQTIRDESIGGTPANRMIHDESRQLFIGPYVINEEGKVRVIPYKDMPGRLTGTARHMTDPANKIYHGTMEEGFYEVDVNSLDVKWLYADGNLNTVDTRGIEKANLTGWHGKGLYSGQGVLVYSNNGEYGEAARKHFDAPSGSLHEWNGKEWTLIRRNQFTEVTGPGGIHGNKNAETDPIWSTGWDHKSLLLAVRGDNIWQFYRLPKASRTYDGAHGWNTEWPRIRDIGDKGRSDYLMTMHGMFWTFPGDFSIGNARGIRPRSAYLKVIGDFTRWGDRLVFGNDDSAQKEFLNVRKAKGDIEGPGESNSNLWFTNDQILDQLGPTAAEGSVWQNEEIEANRYSDPMLFSGWAYRSVWLRNHSSSAVAFTMEVDESGTGTWKSLGEVTVEAGGALNHIFEKKTAAEWIRLKTDTKANVSAHFVYQNEEKRSRRSDDIFDGLTQKADLNGGLLYSLGEGRRSLGMVAFEYGDTGDKEKIGYYELDEKMQLTRRDDAEMEHFIESKFAIPEKVVTIDSSSVLVVDDKGRRWRLPLGDNSFTKPTDRAALRICREVATERDLFNCHGTFYELPAENADGYAKIRPISSHTYKINDYASYRGLLVMTGIDPTAIESNRNKEHVFVSNDKKAAVWAGVIDDLWKLGKPTGHGGPWHHTEVQKDVPSDPFLIGFYDRKKLKLSQTSNKNVNIKIEVDPGGDGNWMVYKTVAVSPDQQWEFDFPASFQGRWIRFTADSECEATAWLEYN